MVIASGCLEEAVAHDALDVICADDHLLVVAKPSGLLVHRGWGKDRVTLVDLVRRATGSRSVHPVHRLDRGTSGVSSILWARSATLMQPSSSTKYLP